MSESTDHSGGAPSVPPVPPADPYAPQQPYPGAAAQPIVPAYPAAAPAPQQVPTPNYYAQPTNPYSGAQPYTGGQPYAAGQPYAVRPTSGLAVASLILGIAGIVLSFAVFTLLASVAAVVTGHMALKRIRENSGFGGRGLAIAGLVLGYIGAAILAITLLIGVFSLVLLGTVGFLPFFMS